mgnify:CR=1 FL=1
MLDLFVPGVLSALLSALVGGFLGSVVSACVSLRIDANRRKEEALDSLYGLYYALVGYQNSCSMTWGVDDPILFGSRAELSRRLIEATPYFQYLREKDRDNLLKRVWLEDYALYGGDREIAEAGDSLWAKEFSDVLLSAINSSYFLRKSLFGWIFFLLKRRVSDVCGGSSRNA